MPSVLSDDLIEQIARPYLDRGFKWEGLQPWVFMFARAIEVKITKTTCLQAAKIHVKIKPAEGIAQSVINQLENVMTPKEVKAALADEGVQAAIEKQVAAAVKAETKRCIEVVKATEIPEDGGKETKAAIKSIVAGIKG